MINISKFFINNPKIANLILAFAVLSGSLAFFAIENEGYPPVDFGVVTITTVLPGASPKDVELKVTDKIEEALEGIDGIDTLESWSIENLSQITIKIDDKADSDEVKKDIRNAMDQVKDLPIDIKSQPLVTEISYKSVPVAEIAIVGDISMAKKRTYANVLEDQLKSYDSTGKIIKLGYYKQEVKIKADQDKLEKNYVSLSAIMSAIQSQNFRQSSGDLLSESTEKKLVIDSEFKSIEDVKNVIIRSSFEGRNLKVRSVANVEDGFETPEKIVRFNGKPSINLYVQKKVGSDIMSAAKDIQTAITEFNAGTPDDVKAELVVDFSVETRSLFDLVWNNAKLGFVLVIAILILFLEWRVALWTAVGIPTAILIGFTIFPFADISINFISLMAIIIVLGMLVDDAILVAENIYYHKEQGMEGRKAAYIGTKEVLWPVITTVLTTIAAFAPMLVMTGVMGKFMSHMPWVITFILLGSLLECLFILPSHMAHIKLPPKKRQKKNILAPLEKRYEKLVRLTMSYKGTTLFVFALIFGLSVYIAIFGIRFMLFPSDDGLMGYIKYETPRGTPLETTERLSKQIEDVLMSVPTQDLKGFVNSVGERTPLMANSAGPDINSGAVGNFTLHFTPVSTRNKTSTQIINDIREQLIPLKGFTKIEARSLAEGPPVGQAITVTFVSNNDSVREKLKNELMAFLESEDGTTNLADNQGEGKPQMSVALDYALMSRLGLNASQVAATVQAAYDGIVVSSTRKHGEEIDYRVILSDQDRRSLNTLLKLRVPNNQGKLVPIGQVVKLKEKDDILKINHYAADRAITIQGDLDTKVQTSKEINQKIYDKFTPLLTQYPGSRMIFGGEEKDTKESLESLGRALILALVGIYFILVVLFNSFLQPFLVMVAIPYSFSGVIFAFFLHGKPLSFPAMIGMIGLIGVVVNNSLVMISFLNSVRKNGAGTLDNLANAARRRFRPIVLTSLTTAAGLFPTAYGFGGDNPVIVPMILAIAWGLIFSSFVSLILIPSLYVVAWRIEVAYKKGLSKVLRKLRIRRPRNRAALRPHT